jgi:ribonuclease HIII
MRQIILGTDEAGYGSNLGPLVVSLTAWEVSSDNLSFLFEPLRKEGIFIGDSKKLYHGGSIAVLESGVLAPLQTLKKSLPPIANDETKIERLAEKFETVLCQHQVRLLDMQYRCVEPEEFNQLLDCFDSKGTLLSRVTLRLIADQLEKFPQDKVLVLCDKHGGRNRYLDILTEFFPGEFIHPVQEIRESSIYRLASPPEESHRSAVSGREFRFLAKGESQLPIALASMLSKYHRELAMRQFNAFWQSHIPDLQPTAGYPEDAKRFKQQIAEVQKKLGIADESLWRKR